MMLSPGLGNRRRSTRLRQALLDRAAAAAATVRDRRRFDPAGR
ncbi:MAG: hypothetical protein OXK16_00785 [bacterium]|nr:hypothetical protein [bacterium]